MPYYDVMLKKRNSVSVLVLKMLNVIVIECNKNNFLGKLAVEFISKQKKGKCSISKAHCDGLDFIVGLNKSVLKLKELFSSLPGTNLGNFSIESQPTFLLQATS